MYSFNAEQQQLIDAPLNQTTVGVAPAGTGKTTTSLARAKRVLDESSDARVLMVTFTKNAAKEIKDRMVRMVGEQTMRRVTVGTFHSVMAQLVRQNAEEIGLFGPQISILDEKSADNMFHLIIEQHPEWHDDLRDLCNAKDSNKLTKKDTKKVSGKISTLVNTALPNELETGVFSNDTLERLRNEGVSEKYAELLFEIFIESTDESSMNGVMTYDHILYYTHYLVKEGLVDKFADALSHVIVDEYQDTNALQDEFVRAVAKRGLTIIGDVDQSIYEWRGGRSELMEQHAREGQVINLVQNYRSVAPVIDVANKIIKNNTTGSSIRKALVSTKTKNTDVDVQLWKSASGSEEARTIIRTIQHSISNGMLPKDIAILTRSRQGYIDLQNELKLSSLPINDTTKFADFMSSDLVVDTMNFMKVYINPRDKYAFMSVINRPSRGIGTVFLKKLEECAKALDLSVSQYILYNDFTKDFPTPAKQKILNDLKSMYDRVIEPYDGDTLRTITQYLLETSGYIDWQKGLKIWEQTQTNLEILYRVLDEFDMKYQDTHDVYNLYDVISEFLMDMSTSATVSTNPDGVVVSTIHGAKGLEWKHVYVIGMEEGLFPSPQSDIESERRNAYVAYTRAIDSLILCYSQRRVAVSNDPDGEALKLSQFAYEVLPVTTYDLR